MNVDFRHGHQVCVANAFAQPDHLRMPLPPVPSLLPRSRLSLITDVLRNAGYTREAAFARMGYEQVMFADYRPGVEAIARYRARRISDHLDVLIHLLLLGTRMPRQLAEDVLGQAEVAMEDARIVVRDDQHVFSNINIWEHEGCFFVTDSWVGEGFSKGVLPILEETCDLRRVVPRRGYDAALDLCTGSGIQGILASRHCNRVVATDVSERALAFARFNCELNDVDNVECRVADVYDGVPTPSGGWDLITANPPYNPVVDSRAGANSYSGGPTGEEVAVRILETLPDQLSDEGTCCIVQLFVEWRETRDSSVLAALERLRSIGTVELVANPVPFERVVDSYPATWIDREWLRAHVRGFRFGTATINRRA